MAKIKELQAELAGLIPFMQVEEFCMPAVETNKPDYCTQNNGDCVTCSLVNYGRDCQNNKVRN